MKTSISVKLTRGRVACIITALVFLFLLTPYPAPAALQSDRVLEKRPVAEGLALEKHLVTVGGEQTLIYIMKADLDNPYLKINTLVGEDGTLNKNARVTDMAVGAGAVAAVNADFFQMNESGRPIGMTYRDGRLITSPPLRNDMFGWAVDKDGVPLIEIFNFSGKVTAANGKAFPLAGINKPSYFQSGEVNSHDNTLLMYNRFWGRTSRGKTDDQDDVVEVFVNSDVVTGILVNQAGKDIPENGYVLAGRGSAAEYIKSNIKAGDRITVDYTVGPEGDKLWAGTGGWSLLVDKGRVMSGFPADIYAPNARTAVGYSADRKKLFIVTVEKSGSSRGVTLDELAEYMAGLGVERALNLDGGGSTTLAVRPLGEEKPVLVNKPKNDVQRLVPTALGFFSSAPRGELAGLVLKGPDQVFPGEKITFTAKGYDSHYNPYPVNQQDVKFSVASGLGSFAGNVFTARDSGLAAISASFGGMKGTKEIRVLSPADFKKITAAPSTVVVPPGGSIELKIAATGYDGIDYLLPVSNYSASVDPALGLLENGRFKASAGPGAGEIKVSYGHHSLVIPVTVRSEDQAVVQYNPGQPAVLTLGDLTVRFGGGAFDAPLTISAAYGGELSGPVPQRYKPVSAVRLEALGAGAAGLNEPAQVTWRFASGESGRVAVIQFAGGKWQELPSKVSEGEGKAVCRILELGPLALVRDQQPPVSFKDMNGHWAVPAVSRLNAAGIVGGYPDGTFMPSKQITRAEFVVMFCRAMGWQPVQGGQNFRDSAAIPGWAGGYILAAVQKGVVSGYEDRTFRPSNPVTRAEMAAMMSRALSLPPAGGIQLGRLFVDGRAVDAWAVDPVSRVVAAGIMGGDSEKRFRARDRATRAESAVLLNNMLDYLLR
ncbi:MAG: S-layer homology domain-containing protein [Peptococcaceae bacterium]|nr:S-layer homology domain-containing protein [Peptococcaceae bacterium]